MKLAYALKENKSLIIDLEEFSLNKDIFDGGLNISDLIYYCLKENSNFNIKLDAIVKKYNNTDIIPPVNNISDISEINEDIWAELIIKIKDSGRYGDIIIDVSNLVGDIFKIFKIEFSEKQWQSLFQFVKFGLVGVFNTVFSYAINIGCIMIFRQTAMDADMRKYVANAIAFVISVFASFLLNRKFVIMYLYHI